MHQYNPIIILLDTMAAIEVSFCMDLQWLMSDIQQAFKKSYRIKRLFQKNSQEHPKGDDNAGITGCLDFQISEQKV